MTTTPIELVHIHVDNGDQCLFMNGDLIFSLEAEDFDGRIDTPLSVAQAMTKCMPGQFSLRQYDVQTPSVADWNWGDIYDLAVSSAPSDTDRPTP